MRVISIVTFTVLAAVCLSGCSGVQNREASPSPDGVPQRVATTASVDASAVAPATSAPSNKRVRVWMKPQARLNGDSLTVAVKTNLIDGSRVQWEVGPLRGDQQWDVYRTGDAAVDDGAFRLKTSVASVPGRKLYVFLVFSTANSQPTEVIQKYGEFGWNLRGDHRNGHGDYQTIEYWVTVPR